MKLFSRHTIDLISMPPFTYAVTQTLAPSFYRLKASTQFDKSWELMRPILRNTCASYEAYAELTTKCNIHWHMVCQFLTPYHKDIYIDFARRVGFVDAKFLATEEDEIRWNTYCSKDVMRTFTLICQKPVRIWNNQDTELIKQLRNLVSIPIEYIENAANEETILSKEGQRIDKEDSDEGSECDRKA